MIGINVRNTKKQTGNNWSDTLIKPYIYIIKCNINKMTKGEKLQHIQIIK